MLQCNWPAFLLDDLLILRASTYPAVSVVSLDSCQNSINWINNFKWIFNSKRLRNYSATRVHSAHSAMSQRAFWIESAMNLHFVYHTRIFQMKLYIGYNYIMSTRSPKSVANLWTTRKRRWSATGMAEVPDSAARAQHIIGLQVQPDLWSVWLHWQWQMGHAVAFQNPMISIVTDLSVGTWFFVVGLKNENLPLRLHLRS